MADPGGNASTSIRFAIARGKGSGRKPAAAVNLPDDGPAKVLLSSVGAGGKFVTVDGRDADSLGKAEKKTYVIPKQENTLVIGSSRGRTFTPSFRPPTSDAPVGGEGADKFELAAPTGPAITEYGLQHMGRKVKQEDGQEPEAARPSAAAGITERLREEQAYKQDLDALPDVAPVEAYEAMPIEEFGMAMLRGMGWSEGMGVGRNRKVVEAIEYLKRPERLGLGAQSVPTAPTTKRPRKMGDALESTRREDLVLAPDADGRQRHVRKLDEKLVNRAELQPGPRAGKDMAVVAGKHGGLQCKVVELVPSKEEGAPERWLVQLKPSDEHVKVLASELGELSDLKALQKLQQQEAGARGGRERDEDQGRRERDRDRRGDRDGARVREGDRERERDGGREKARDREREREGRADRKDRDRDSERDRDSGRDRERERDRQRDQERGGERDRDRRGEKDTGRSRDYEGPAPSSKKRAASSDEEEPVAAPSRKPWLFPNLVVRVLDKKACGGKVYLKKGVVVDVHPGPIADVSMEEGGRVLQLSQDKLETVIPKSEGAGVLVVAGSLRGSRARLLKANTAEGVAAVQLAADFRVQRLLLDDVCMYVGPMDEDME